MELLCYLDPSAISVLVTSLTAAFVAVAATLVIYWRKLKNKFKKKSDQENNKDAEGDINLIDESALADETEQPAESEKQKKTTKSKKKE